MWEGYGIAADVAEAAGCEYRPGMAMSGWLARASCLLPLAAACATHQTGVPSPDRTSDAPPVSRNADVWPSAYFPLARDRRWVYRERTGLFGRRHVVVTAESMRAVRGSEGPLFVVRERGDRSYFGIDDSGLLGYAVEGDFVVVYTALAEDSRGDLRLFGAEGLRMLPLEPEDGQSWEQEWHLFATPESRGAVRHWSARVARSGSLRVPAGRFRDVIKIELEYRDPSLSPDRAQLSFEDYYAAGVGLVKSVSRDPESGPWRTITRELESFEEPRREPIE